MLTASHQQEHPPDAETFSVAVHPHGDQVDRELRQLRATGFADIERVAAGPDATGWSPREQAILTAVDELHATRDVTEATWERLRSHLDDVRLIELVLLAGHYEMLATAIGTLRIQQDTPRR